ncbi:hypothetical protein ACFOOM_07700 [Streptomyces echinoruber]|uniref:Uncharacterized protein n=1 Tax=Streptomyces echinoruber TaxID=68898 RepID=A0A918R1P9_9ACTN|nr:hypothetical protein [Streptomyces echinoruber]GGZ80407.1 hypothetical protein GCM10010389_17790 [Streptomyces echinoruber]
MTLRHPAPGHRSVVAAALEDWWLTTDPAEPFDPDDLADHVDTYLASSGYLIAPDITPNRMPLRSVIIADVLITLFTLAATLGAARQHQWGWTALGTVVTAALARTCIRDLAHRHRTRGQR